MKPYYRLQFREGKRWVERPAGYPTLTRAKLARNQFDRSIVHIVRITEKREIVK